MKRKNIKNVSDNPGNPVIRITGRQYDDRFQDELVDHVVQFSLSGLNGVGEGDVP